MTPTGAAPGDERILQELQEAHDVCRALRAGVVDGVVVDDEAAESARVFLFTHAYARYGRLVEQMAQGAVTVGPAGEILFANRSFSEMLGAPPAALVGSALAEWVAPADRRRVAELVAPGVEPQAAAATFVRRDGASRRATLSSVLASDEFSTFLVTEETSEEAKDAQAVLEAIRKGRVDAFVVDDEHVVVLGGPEPLSRALIERMPQGAVTTGADGVILQANQCFSAMVGMPAERLVGTELARVVAPSDQAAFSALLLSGGSASAKFTLCGANGRKELVQALVTSFEHTRLFLFSDLTEQKRRQALDANTSRFLGMLASEFHDMLGTIQEAVQELKREVGDPRGAKPVGRIERQARRMLALVEELRGIYGSP